MADITDPTQPPAGMSPVSIPGSLPKTKAGPQRNGAPAAAKLVNGGSAPMPVRTASGSRTFSHVTPNSTDAGSHMADSLAGGKAGTPVPRRG